ncbi:HlyD family secretion protein [Yersinia intermedia ATCC 29909]|nr:HlyD family secretion protein [Yersinia intermedia ATCC 29909]OWF88232.1 hypothetical protein B4916_20020 [Yersinia intermedia]
MDDAARAIAELELANTQVRVLHDGRVVGLTISAGEFVVPNQVIRIYLYKRITYVEDDGS